MVEEKDKRPKPSETVKPKPNPIVVKSQERSHWTQDEARQDSVKPATKKPSGKEDKKR